MKKYLLLILSFLCLSFTAQAAEGLDVNVRGKGTEITINGTAKADGKVSVFVSKSNKAETYKDVVFADEIICDEYGDFSVSFNMPDKFDQSSGYDATGSYTVFVASEGLGRESKVLEYVALDKQKDLLKILNEKDTSTEIKELLLNSSNKNAFTSMGINIEGYKSYPTLQKDIADIVFAFKPYDLISEFEERYNDAFATALINNSTNVSNLSDELKKGGYVSFVIDGTDISKDTKTFNFVLEYVLKHKKYNNVSEVEKTMKDGIVVYDLKNANKASLTNVVKKYAEYIGIKNHPKYSTYAGNLTMQTIVNEKTILSLPTGGADSIEAFVQKFIEQLSAYKAPTPTGGGSSGGAGGGSGSASGNIVIGGLPSSQTAPKNYFNDMDNYDWAKEAVEFLYKKGIIRGTDESKFSPQDDVTREQFTKMIVEFADIYGSGGLPFDDVKPGEWYYDYVEAAYLKGIISGISDTMFGAGKSLTREDSVVIIERCMNLLEINTDDVKEYLAFSDEGEISEYAKDSVINMYKKGIINGMNDGVFAPKETVTRAQAAKMIYELCKVRGDVK